MNIARSAERLRALRVRGEYPPDGLAAAVDALIDRGATAGTSARCSLGAAGDAGAHAHPTEARRRSRSIT